MLNDPFTGWTSSPIAVTHDVSMDNNRLPATCGRTVDRKNHLAAPMRRKNDAHA
jgi:hypothetical protein